MFGPWAPRNELAVACAGPASRGRRDRPRCRRGLAGRPSDRPRRPVGRVRAAVGRHGRTSRVADRGGRSATTTGGRSGSRRRRSSPRPASRSTSSTSRFPPTSPSTARASRRSRTRTRMRGCSSRCTAPASTASATARSRSCARRARPRRKPLVDAFVAEQEGAFEARAAPAADRGRAPLGRLPPAPALRPLLAVLLPVRRGRRRGRRGGRVPLRAARRVACRARSVPVRREPGPLLVAPAARAEAAVDAGELQPRLLRAPPGAGRAHARTGVALDDASMSVKQPAASPPAAGRANGRGSA